MKKKEGIAQQEEELCHLEFSNPHLPRIWWFSFNSFKILEEWFGTEGATLQPEA
ncbi:hypothetical protein ACQKGI_20435 [Peribacillus muralis]|uniref:hypothetical protein n=1 Tax=Peribacillus muralis TaxID=264697 RepID=UPI003D036140